MAIAFFDWKIATQLRSLRVNGAEPGRRIKKKAITIGPAREHELSGRIAVRRNQA